MSAASVQFFGIDPVLKAYSNADVPCFSLWAGKTMCLKYDGWTSGEFIEPSTDEGAKLLNDYLNAMYQGSTAIYTLKVYEDLKAKEKITPKTEYSTAFNFKLFEQSAGMGVVPGMIGGRIGQEFEKIHARLDEIQGDDEDDENEPEEKSFISTITGGLIKDTSEFKEIIDLVKPLFVPAAPETQAVRTVGNVQHVSDISSEVDSTDKSIRIKKAFDDLEILDSKFLEHLELLAAIAKRDPAQFKQFLLILESLK